MPYSPAFPYSFYSETSKRLWESIYGSNISKGHYNCSIYDQTWNDADQNYFHNFVVSDLGAYFEILDNYGSIIAILNKDDLTDDPDSFLPAHGSSIKCDNLGGIKDTYGYYGIKASGNTMCYGYVNGSDLFILLNLTAWFRRSSFNLSEMQSGYYDYALKEPVYSMDGFSFNKMSDVSNIKELSHFDKISSIIFAEVSGNPIFVACADFSGNDCLYYSNNGFQWSTAYSPFSTGGFKALAFGMTPSSGVYGDPLDTPTFVAVGTGAYSDNIFPVAYSHDGMSWSGASSVASEMGTLDFRSVAYTPLSGNDETPGCYFIAGSAYTTGTHQTVCSITGATWVDNWYSDGSSFEAFEIAAMAAGTVNVSGTPTPTYVIGNLDTNHSGTTIKKLCYANFAGSFTEISSLAIDIPDPITGNNFSLSSLGGSAYIHISSLAFGVVNNTPTFVAAGRGLYYSTDGVNWTYGQISYLAMSGIPIHLRVFSSSYNWYTTWQNQGVNNFLWQQASNYTAVSYIESNGIPMFVAVGVNKLMVSVNTMVYSLDGILWGPSLRYPSKYDDTSIITLNGNQILKLNNSESTVLRVHSSIPGLLRQVLWNGTSYVILTSNGIYGSGTSAGAFTLASNTSGIDWRHGIVFKGLFVCLGSAVPFTGTDITQINDVVYWSLDGLTFNVSTLPAITKTEMDEGDLTQYIICPFMYLIPIGDSHIMLIADVFEGTHNQYKGYEKTNEYRLFSSDGKTFSTSDEYFIRRNKYDAWSLMREYIMGICYCPSFPSDSRWLAATANYSGDPEFNSRLKYSSTGKDRSWQISINETPYELSSTHPVQIVYGYDHSSHVYRAVIIGSIYGSHGFYGTTLDGKNWTLSAIVAEQFNTVIYASNASNTDGYFIAAGSITVDSTLHTIIMRSRDGMNWVDVTPSSGVTIFTNAAGTAYSLSAFAIVSSVPTVVFATPYQSFSYVIVTTDFGTTWSNATLSSGTLGNIRGLAGGDCNGTSGFIMIDSNVAITRSVNGLTWDAPIAQGNTPPSTGIPHISAANVYFTVLNNQPIFYSITPTIYIVSVSYDWGLTWSNYRSSHTGEDIFFNFVSTATGVYDGETSVIVYNRENVFYSSDGYKWNIEANQRDIEDESMDPALKRVASGWNAVFMDYTAVNSVTTTNEVRITKQDFQSVKEVNDVWAYHNLAILEYIYGTRIFNDITPQFRDWLESHRSYNFDITRRPRGMWRETGDGLDPLWGVIPPDPDAVPEPPDYVSLYVTHPMSNTYTDSETWFPTPRVFLPLMGRFDIDSERGRTFGYNDSVFILAINCYGLYVRSLINDVITNPVLPGVEDNLFTSVYHTVTCANGTFLVLGITSTLWTGEVIYEKAWFTNDGVTWSGPFTTNYIQDPGSGGSPSDGGNPFFLDYCPNLGGNGQGFYFFLRESHSGVVKSPDGISWITVTNIDGGSYTSVRYDPISLCCTDTAVYVNWWGSVFASTNGTTFTQQYPSGSSTSWGDLSPEFVYLATSPEYCCCCLVLGEYDYDKTLYIYRSSAPGQWEYRTSSFWNGVISQFTYSDGLWIISASMNFYIFYSTNAFTTLQSTESIGYMTHGEYTKIIPITLLASASSGSEESSIFIQSDNEGVPGYQEDRQPPAYVASTFYRLPISADPDTPIDTKVVTVTEPEPIHHQIQSPPFVKRVKAPHYRVVKNRSGDVDKLSNQ